MVWEGFAWYDWYGAPLTVWVSHAMVLVWNGAVHGALSCIYHRTAYTKQLYYLVYSIHGMVYAWYGIMWCGIVLYCILWCGMVWCDVV